MPDVKGRLPSNHGDLPLSALIFGPSTVPDALVCGLSAFVQLDLNPTCLALSLSRQKRVRIGIAGHDHGKGIRSIEPRSFDIDLTQEIYYSNVTSRTSRHDEMRANATFVSSS